MLLISFLLVVTGGVAYDLIEERAPERENHFLYLIISYLSAGLLLLTYLLISNYNFKNIISDINIYSFLVGAVAMISDYGLIISYNVGWKISKLNITYSIFVFLILFVIGFLFFNEQISNFKLLGISLCIISLFFLNHKNIKKTGRR
jgi:drug/metabolite transporter (DMT)-like permease